MTTSAVSPARPSALRLRRWGVAAAVVLLVAGGALGWRWLQEQAERRDALQMAQDDRFDEAEPRLRRLQERRPDDVAVARALALGYLTARRFDEAETAFGRWIALRPGEYEPYHRRLDLWMNQQKILPAIADAEQALRIKPDDLRTRELLAELLVLDGRFDRAEQEALRCRRAQPNNPHVWHLLARAYQGQGRHAQAAEMLDQILRLAPDFTDALTERAELHLDAREYDQAVALLRKAAERPGPRGLAALYSLSVALARAGRDDEAKKVLAEMQWRRALDIWSEDKQRDTNAGLQARVVEAMQAAGKTDEAVRFLNDILRRNPQAEGTRELLRQVETAKGRQGDKGTRKPGDREGS